MVLAVVEAGSGRLIFTNANTYLGGTVLTGGTLQLGDGTNGHDGSVAANGDITDDSALVYDLYGAQTYTGIISGFGNLTKLGNGTLTLQAANTLSGQTTVSSGTLILANGNALQNSTVAPSGGSVTFSSSDSTFTFGGLTGSGNISLSNTATLVPFVLDVGNNNGSTTYSGVLSGTGSLTKVGTGTLALGGNNTYSGSTTVSGGMLEFASKMRCPARPRLR